MRWVLHLRPFRPLELFFLYIAEEEFGTDLRVYFGPRSRAVPTEDAYVFAWDYLAVLARYGRREYPLLPAAPDPDWWSVAEFAPPGARPIQDTALGAREEVLPHLTAPLVEVAVLRLESGRSQPQPGGWEVVWPLLGDAAFRLTLTAGQVDLAFDRHGARKYAPELLLSFAWLYINALIREYRQVDPALPRLSRYL
ncbi:MAG: hypothetical protein K6T55_00075 [Syntrophobacterales bacterium]|nr:hypothetical protein [Syntrophobacterales bacterium]